MKKYLRKISALFISLVMVLSVCASVFAAEETPSTSTSPSAQITINNAAGATFSYIQVIKPDTSKSTGWAFTTTAIADKYKAALGKTDDQDAIRMLLNAEAKATTGAATTEQIENALEAILADTTIMVDAKSATSPITVDSAGVYAIKGTEEDCTYSAMAAYIAFKDYDTSTGIPTDLEDAIINAKKTTNKIEKTSQEKDKVTEIGRTETYTITGTVPYLPGTKNRYYKIQDTITGAKYKVIEAEGVNKGKLEVTVQVVGTDFLKKFYVTPTENTFTLDLHELVPEDNKYANQTITITYQAIVTDVEVNNTVKAGSGDNWDKPEYGSDNESLFTGRIILTKYGDKEKTQKLPKAGFKVTKGDSTTALTFTAVNKDAQGNPIAGSYRYDPKGTIAEVFTDSNGTLTISGLDVAGKDKEGKDEPAIIYNFDEITAPEGYSINKTPVKVEAKLTQEQATKIIEFKTEMIDTKLGSLPSTGGTGTYIFTVLGVMVMAGVAGMFLISRRKENE